MRVFVAGGTGVVVRRLVPQFVARGLSTLTLDLCDGRIQTIRSVQNPDKLGHLGLVADAWAVVRAANQARRPTE